MKSWLLVAAMCETATGVALPTVPSIATRLLLGEGLAGVAIPLARVAGIALTALGIACCPGPPQVGMLIYGTAVTMYLAYLGLVGGLTGILLWPAIVLHAILTVFLIWGSTKDNEIKCISALSAPPGLSGTAST